MAVNLQDTAFELERLIRQSAEFNGLKNAYNEVNNDPQAKRLFDNFRNIQLQLQQKQMAGQEITQAEVQNAQNTVALAQQNSKISNLINAEQRMSTLITQLNQIIMKPLEEIYGSIG